MARKDPQRQGAVWGLERTANHLPSEEELTAVHPSAGAPQAHVTRSYS